MDKYIQYYLLGINFITFLVFVSDKVKAMHHKWRISEAALLSLALVGGSVGAFLAMAVFHHKTRKPLFRLGIPFIFIIHAAIIIYFKHEHIF